MDRLPVKFIFLFEGLIFSDCCLLDNLDKFGWYTSENERLEPERSPQKEEENHLETTHFMGGS